MGIKASFVGIAEEVESYVCVFVETAGFEKLLGFVHAERGSEQVS